MSINVGQAVGYLDLDTTKFKRGFASALTDLEAFKKTSSTTGDKLTALGASMTSVGKGLTLGLTLPLAGLGAGITKVTASFEAGMSEVQAISGATGKDFEALKAKAKEMGAKTKFSATESAEALKYMAMAGWDTNKMLAGLPGVMNLAAASGENLGTVSDIVTDAMTAFKMEAGQAGHFADVLATASSKSNTNVGLMGETFKYVAPVAGALGYNCEDTAVAIGLMANAGIKGSQAGTALRSMLSRLAKPTDEVQKAMKDLGISLTDSSGKMKPLNQVIQDMRKSFKNLSKDQQAQYAATIAGQEGMSGLLAIVGASDKDFNTLTKAINKADGASERMAKTMNNNFKGQVTILKSTIESIGISLGESLLPSLKGATKFLQKAADGFNSLSDGTKQTIVQLGLFAAGTGPALMATGKLLTVVGKLSNKSITFSSILQAIPTPVAIAGGALMGLYYIFEKYQEKVHGAANEVKEMAKAHEESVGKIELSATRANNYADKLNKLMGVEEKSSDQKRLMKAYVEQLNSAMEGLNLRYDEENDKLYDNTGKVIDNVDAIKQQTNELKKRALAEAYTKNASESLEKYAENSDKVTEAMKKQTDVHDKIVEFKKKHSLMTESEINQLYGLEAEYQGLKTDIEKYQEGMAEALIESQKWSNMVEIQSGALKNLEGIAAQAGINIPQSLVDGIKTGHYTIPTTLGELNDLIKFDSAVQKAKDAGIDIPDKLQAGILNGEIDVADATKEMEKLTKKEVDKLPGDFENAGKKATDDLKTAVLGAIPSIVDISKQAMDSANAQAQTSAGDARNAGNTFGDSLSSGISDKQGTVWSAGNAIANSANSGASSISLYGTGQYMAQGFANGMASLIDYVGRVASSIAQRALNSANRTLDNRSPSHKAEKIGLFGGLGLAVGFAKASPQVGKEAKATALNALNSMTSVISKANPPEIKLKTAILTDFNTLNGISLDPDYKLSTTGLKSVESEGLIATIAGAVKEAMKDIVVNNKVDVVMQDGDVYLDSERVGRKVAPVVSRVQARGI